MRSNASGVLLVSDAACTLGGSAPSASAILGAAGQRPHRQAFFRIFHERVKDARRNAAAGGGDAWRLVHGRAIVVAGSRRR